jgi:hypothetical protein
MDSLTTTILTVLGLIGSEVPDQQHERGVVEGVAAAENVQIGSMTLRCSARKLAGRPDPCSR